MFFLPHPFIRKLEHIFSLFIQLPIERFPNTRESLPGKIKEPTETQPS